MHSRACLLLKRDLMNMRRFPQAGIEVCPMNGDLFNWNARIEGMPDTLWQDGVFYVNLSFDEDHNSSPPLVHFITIPFHPNVDDQDGNILGTKIWTSEGTVPSLLLSLQKLLSYPDLEESSIRNHAAAELLIRAPRTYMQTVMDCVYNSIKCDVGFHSFEEILLPEEAKKHGVKIVYDKNFLEEREKRRKKVQVKLVSFDNYHTLWRGIATSVVDYGKHSDNDLIQLLKKDRHFIYAHTKDDSVSSTLQQRRQDHQMLKYGIFQERKLEPELKIPAQKLTNPWLRQSCNETDKIDADIQWSQDNHDEELQPA